MFNLCIVLIIYCRFKFRRCLTQCDVRLPDAPCSCDSTYTTTTTTSSHSRDRSHYWNAPRYVLTAAYCMVI